MTRYTFQAFTNETRGSRFIRFQSGDLFHYAGRIAVEAESLEEAREAAWMVGNREALDADGQRWPFFVRSLSVGDLLCEIESRTIVGHAVDVLGFLPGLVLAFEPGVDGIVVRIRCDCGKGSLCPEYGTSEVRVG